MPPTSDHWEELAKTEPHWAVLSSDDNLSGALDEAAFFQSGADHIEHVFAEVRRRVDPGFAPRRALDFGCGVGRLLVPLAARCESVTGLDVSPTMLQLARANLEERGHDNATVAEASTLGGLRGAFDLVHSVMVIQHIPTAEGWRVLDDLVAAIRPGGVGVIQLYLRVSGSRADRWRNTLRTRAQPLRLAINGARGRPRFRGLVLMHEYDAQEALWRLARAGARDLAVDLEVSPQRETSATFYFRKAE